MEILNENDNLPMFAEDMVHSFTISEVRHFHKYKHTRSVHSYTKDTRLKC